MDCFALLAMTKVVNGSEFFFFFVFGLLLVVCRLLRRFTPRNDEGGKGWYSQTRHCEALKKPWQSQYGVL